jgi:hypothetical protein
MGATSLVKVTPLLLFPELELTVSVKVANTTNAKTPNLPKRRFIKDPPLSTGRFDGTSTCIDHRCID